MDTLRYGEQTGGFTVELPYRYHIRDWLTDIADINTSAQPFSAYYTYRPDGNITLAEYRNTGAQMEPHFKCDYRYDALNRLTSADYAYYFNGACQSSSYFDVYTLGYDDNGNILNFQRRKETGSLIDELTYSYDPNNRLLRKSGYPQSVADAVAATTEVWDAEDTQFSYDPNGNVIRVIENGVAKFDTINYDHRNLPTRIVKGDGTEIIYCYNSAGQRLYKKVGSQTPEHYILDDDQTVAVYGNGAVKY